MNPSPPDPLAALHDIHLPAPVPFWPIAPGWWALLGLAVFLAAGLWIFRRARANRTQRWPVAAARELERLEAAYREKGDRLELAAGLSAFLRRTALMGFPDAKIAALHGDEWVGFLCRAHLDPEEKPTETAASPGTAPSRPTRVAQELVEAAYRDRLDGDEDPEEWIAFAHRWLEEAS
ncbi:MAG TPA: DUF4381 domain-containing protein [Deltaproteobacteria bacterium]|nr:DUF4381 domain-containing protein [Deltaproteobacteria bacterium]